MNYIKQVNTFYRLLPNNPLSSNAQCLYLYLLNKNNEFGWAKEFTIANSIVMGFTSLNISALQRARNELKQKGYIGYKKGVGNHAGIYEMMQFEQPYEQQSEQQTKQQTDSNVNTLNKRKENKTKQKNQKKNTKKKYGEYGNVELDDEQYEKLRNEFPADYKARIQRLDDYMQSSGKKYQDHLATIRVWARKEEKPENKPVKVLRNYSEVNTAPMSEEEYLRLVRGG